MDKKLIEEYKVELGCAAVFVVCLIAWLALKAPDALAGNVAAGIFSLLGAIAVGVLAGLLARRAFERAPMAELKARVDELSGRPTVEAYRELNAQTAELREGLASAEAAIADLSAQLVDAARDRSALAGALSEAKVTAQLDQFSDFQLLAMCDICDAEGETGYLIRAFGDPAMEQLLALGAVSFDSSQDDRRDLKWTLKPEWRQAIRAHRMQIDERTRALRERRSPKVASVVSNDADFQGETR